MTPPAHGNQTPERTADAIRAWALALGDANVLHDPQACGRAATATYRTKPAVVAVLRPSTVSEVQEVVRIANQFRVPIYPVSRGRNWGMGSKVPAMDGCAVVELQRMNRILDYDDELGLLTVEPGVSFVQAQEFLAERQATRILNVTMGPPDGSLIGNALERGHGYGVYRERFVHSCAMQVVLPTGELVRTGLARHEGAHAARLHRFGSGPQLDGLFVQSNFGVATEMTFWLAPVPEDFTMFRFGVKRDADLAALCRALRKLSEDPTIVATLHNRGRLEFDMNTHQPPGQIAKTLPDDFYLEGRGQIHADTRLEGLAKRQKLLAALEPIVGNVGYLSPFRRTVGRYLRTPIKKFFNVELTDYMLSPPLGQTSDARVRAMYSVKPMEKRISPSEAVDLDRDGCGVMWFCPVLPLEAKHLARTLELAEEILDKRGFPSQFSFVTHRGRSLDSFCAIAYDRDDEDADARAAEVFHEVQVTFERAGYPPYRLPVQHMSHQEEPPGHAALMRRLKQALDPNDIMAPGRYDARAQWPDA